jgi:uncharacterized protein (DUF433 family)
LANALSALYPKDAKKKAAVRRHAFGEATIGQEERGMFDRITFDSQIMGGRASIRGMRIPVSVIVGQIAHGATFEEILEGYPDLEREDIQQAVEYAAWLTQEEIHFR